MVILRRIMTIGKRNVNGLVYTQEMANSITNHFENHGYILGQRGSLGDEASLEVTRVTHQVIELCMLRDIHLFAKIQFLETPMSKKFMEYFKEHKDDFVFRPEGTGNIEPNTNKIYGYNVIAVNAIEKSKRQNQIVVKNED